MTTQSCKLRSGRNRRRRADFEVEQQREKEKDEEEEAEKNQAKEFVGDEYGDPELTEEDEGAEREERTKEEEGTEGQDEAQYGDGLVANRAIMMRRMAEASESVTVAFARAEAEAGCDPMVIRMLRETHEKASGQAASCTGMMRRLKEEQFGEKGQLQG